VRWTGRGSRLWGRAGQVERREQRPVAGVVGDAALAEDCDKKPTHRWKSNAVRAGRQARWRRGPRASHGLSARRPPESLAIDLGSRRVEAPNGVQPLIGDP